MSKGREASSGERAVHSFLEDGERFSGSPLGASCDSESAIARRRRRGFSRTDTSTQSSACVGPPSTFAIRCSPRSKLVGSSWLGVVAVMVTNEGRRAGGTRLGLNAEVRPTRESAAEANDIII
eukprot:scaffold102147_cov29-Tisochrysis_lutea.AAC.2